MGKLDGKVALVTGGGSGFGEATALLWAREGARLVVVDVAVDGAERVAEAIRGEGGKATAVTADVSRPEDARRMVQAAVDGYGRLLAVNVMGVFLGTKYALPVMIRGGGGSILSTGSDSAFLGNRGLSMYSATKGAVLAFMRVVAMEYAKEGIRANTVSPGAGQTPMHAELIEGKKDVWKQVEAGIPMGRACRPEDLARAALFFASDDSRYVTGANLMVDGGWSVHGL